jgi:hypothetical protein
MTWGWATWAHKWELMYRELLSTPRTSLLSFFNRRANYWDIGAQRSKAGLIDAWDLPLASAQFRLKKLTLIPPVNLIKNIGFDSQATHTTSDIFPLNILTFELPSNYQQLEMQSPKTFDYDQKLEEKVYRISTKHSLLRIWAFFSDRLFFKSIYESPLAARIERVLIPNSPKAP